MLIISGGSPYIATKINEAKDYMESKKPWKETWLQINNISTINPCGENTGHLGNLNYHKSKCHGNVIKKLSRFYCSWTRGCDMHSNTHHSWMKIYEKKWIFTTRSTYRDQQEMNQSYVCADIELKTQVNR